MSDCLLHRLERELSALIHSLLSNSDGLHTSVGVPSITGEELLPCVQQESRLVIPCHK